MLRLRVYGLVFMVHAVAVPTLAEDATLREAADARGLFIGAATNEGFLNSGEPGYKSTEQEQYSMTVAENSCKVGPTHPEPNKYSFDGCDKVFAAAAEAKQKVRGHNLCWNHQNPSWLNTSMSHDQLVDALNEHIQTVVSRYGEKAYAWDVVNEAVADGGKQPAGTLLKKVFDPWLPAVPDFMDRAFIAARKAGGPAVKLFYNDYGMETISPKSDRAYEMVKGMLSRGIPIDGIGFQTHIANPFLHKIASMEKNLRRFADLGLEVHITELDVRACDAKTKCDAAALQMQAQVYSGLLKMCLDISKCKAFVMWGFTDKHTWITNFQNPTHKDEMPLPFDMQYKKKAAFFSMLQALENSPTPSPPPSPPSPTRTYDRLKSTCANSKAVSGSLSVGSTAECEQLCNKQTGCTSFDTDGSTCYLKSHCEGQVGECSGWCGYRLHTELITDTLIVL